MANQINQGDRALTLITPAAASKICGLTPEHLARMANKGLIAASKPGGTHRRYHLAEIEALAVPTANAGECAQ